MVQKSSILRVIRMLLVICWATVPFYANAERGFWRLEQAPTSPKILEAAKSIFQITVPTGELVKVDLKRFPSALLAMQSLKDHADLNSGERLLRERALTKCFKQKKDVCSLLSTFELGTGFLVGDRMTLVSAFHVFRDVLRSQSEKSFSIIIQDRNGKIIFGSDVGDVANVAFAHSSALQTADKTSPIVDAIELKLSKALSGFEPLTVGNDGDLKTGDAIINIGYPGPTYDRAKVLAKPDSDGVSQLATYGNVIDYSDYFKRTGKDINKVQNDLITLIKAATFYTDSDSYFGMSGAPALNSIGEVVGMVIGSYPVDGSASTQTSVGTIRASWILNLRNLR